MIYYFIEDKMQKALQRVFSFFIKTGPPRKRNVRKTRAQSLVEVAISFPILIILFSGVVEFGFILNYYLSLLDATREAARLYSGGDPFVFDPTNPLGADTFYYEGAYQAFRLLDPSVDYTPPSSYKGRRIVLDPAVDDVIVSVYGATGNTINLWRTQGPYHLFKSGSMNNAPGSVGGNYPSIFNATDIGNTRVSGAPDAGILVVEVHYNYHHVLGLPWMTAWLPNPLHLRAYTIMPIRSAEPAP
jgi:hypothetical protein